MEGSGVGSGGCVVYFDCMGVSYVVGCCNVVAILSMADMVSLTLCRNCAVHEQCWVCMVCGV